MTQEELSKPVRLRFTCQIEHDGVPTGECVSTLRKVMPLGDAAVLGRYLNKLIWETQLEQAQSDPECE